jgi:hypothetical protein
MPSKNGACTATITKIQDDDDKTFKAKVKFKDGNPDANYSCLDYETMKNLNADKNVYEIEAKGDIPFVTSEEVALVLIDTPGPDNALDSRHGEVTARALDESSKMLVLFVMNGGKINDESQNKFLQSIAKSMSVGGKQSRERFLFVINKLDSYDAEDDDIANETLPETVKNLEKMGIENPNIFPVAALPALLIREYQNISDPERKKKILNQVKPIAEKMVEQGQLHLEQYPHLPHGCQEKIKQELQHAIEANDILGQALVHSGIRGIEETIKLYVTKYCRPAKITNIVQTFGAGLQSAEAVTNTEKEILSQTENLKKIEKRLKQLKSKLVSREENERFKKQISNLALSSEIEQEINNIIKDFEIPLTDCFKDAPAEMEEDKAMSLAKKFAMVANQKQEEFKIKVSNIIDKDINNKGQQLVKEYRKKLAILSEEFSGEGLKINLDSYVQGTILSLDPYQAVNNSLDVRIEKHDEERVRTEKRRRSGWDRLFHPSSWFNPEYDVLVKHMVEVREEVSFISREKLSNLLVSPIRSTIYSERDNVVKFASEQTQIIKESFYKQFDEVDTILAKILNSYQQDTASEVAAKKALARAQDLSEQLKILQKELDDILSI